MMPIATLLALLSLSIFTAGDGTPLLRMPAIIFFHCYALRHYVFTLDYADAPLLLIFSSGRFEVSTPR